MCFFIPCLSSPARGRRAEAVWTLFTPYPVSRKVPVRSRHTHDVVVE